MKIRDLVVPDGYRELAPKEAVQPTDLYISGSEISECQKTSFWCNGLVYDVGILSKGSTWGIFRKASANIYGWIEAAVLGPPVGKAVLCWDRVSGCCVISNRMLPGYTHWQSLPSAPVLPVPPIKVGEYTVDIRKNGVQVGCTFVPWETIDEIQKRREKTA